MNFLKDLGKDLRTEAPAPKIGEVLEDIAEKIREAQLSAKKAGGWASNFLGTGITLGIIVVLTPIKIPLLAAGAVLSFIGYGVSKLIKSSAEESLANLQAQREELLTTHETAITAAPVAAPAKPATPKFNANANKDPEADRIAALEKRVQQLQEEIEGKPLDKPKSFASRLGFGA